MPKIENPITVIQSGDVLQIGGDVVVNNATATQSEGDVTIV